MLTFEDGSSIESGVSNSRQLTLFRLSSYSSLLYRLHVWCLSHERHSTHLHPGHKKLSQNRMSLSSNTCREKDPFSDDCGKNTDHISPYSLSALKPLYTICTFMYKKNPTKTKNTHFLCIAILSPGQWKADIHFQSNLKCSTTTAESIGDMEMSAFQTSVTYVSTFNEMS